MASPTKKLKIRRLLKKVASGKKRKRLVRNHGTTLPLLPLNKPTANEIAQKSKKSR